MKHKVNIIRGRGVRSYGMKAVISLAVVSALDLEGVYIPCEVNILLTDNRNIRRLNRKTRGINRPTDVLSFPAFELIPGKFEAPSEISCGYLMLGDIAMSADKLMSQSLLYSHSLKREASYLTVHSILHLLGYDHTDEGSQKARMREREEVTLKYMDSKRKRRWK